MSRVCYSLDQTFAAVLLKSTWTESDAEAVLAVLEDVVLVRLTDGADAREGADVQLELVERSKVK